MNWLRIIATALLIVLSCGVHNTAMMPAEAQHSAEVFVSADDTPRDDSQNSFHYKKSPLHASVGRCQAPRLNVPVAASAPRPYCSQGPPAVA